MNRKNFLRKLGIGAALVAIAPKVLEGKPEGFVPNGILINPNQVDCIRSMQEQINVTGMIRGRDIYFTQRRFEPKKISTHIRVSEEYINDND